MANDNNPIHLHAFKSHSTPFPVSSDIYVTLGKKKSFLKFCSMPTLSKVCKTNTQ